MADLVISNSTLNGTLDEQIRDLHVDMAVTVLLCVELSWIVVSNGMIMLCFVINRRKSWPVFARYLLALSICDFMNGFTCIAFLVVSFLPEHYEVNLHMCSTVLYLFFTCQCACLFHMLGICLQRSLSIHVSYTTKPIIKSRAPVVVSITSWFVSASICSVPFIVWTHSETYIDHCVIHDLFDNVRNAMGYLAIVYIFPQILTNILYFIASVRLRFIWRKIDPVNNTDDDTCNTVATTSTNYQNEEPNEVGKHTLNIITTGSINKGIDNGGGITSSLQVNTTAVNRITTPRVQNTYTRASIKAQRKVLATIGILTLVFNVCTIPVIVAMLIENQGLYQSRNVRFVVCALFAMNSALNPFVYAIRTEWLKQALRKMLRTVINFLCW